MQNNLYDGDLMMFTSHGTQNNTYMLSKNNKCVIIDPATNNIEIEQFVKNNKLKPIAIILTHAHYDHIGNGFRLANLYNINVYLHKQEKIILEKAHLGDYLNMKIDIDNKCVIYFENKILKLDVFTFNVLLVPGHTPGGIIIKYNNYVFSGDTIFYDSIGRTDLPYSDAQAMHKSIQLFKTACTPNNLILPGHGRIGLLQDIKMHNTFLK